jgi:hypothetical protein
VAAIYQQFYLVPNTEGIRKRSIIINELKKVQASLIESLKKAKYSMGSRNSEFLNDYLALPQFVEDFNEAIKL